MRTEISWISFEFIEREARPSTSIKKTMIKTAETHQVALHVKVKHPLLKKGFLLHHDDARSHTTPSEVYALQKINMEILFQSSILSWSQTMRFVTASLSQETIKRQHQSMLKNYGDGFEKALKHRLSLVLKKWI